MCIILTCEKNIRPDFDLIDDCFANNPDGAGVMWCEDGRVQIAKGFDNPASLFDAIESAPIESRLVIHMRIATSGGIDVGTCHPFPICDRMEALHASDVECDAAIAHNGIIRGMPTNDTLGISDTVSFVSLVVNGMYLNEGITKSVCRRIKKAAPNNRFAIMTSDGEVRRLGAGWETVTKGIYASNSSWAWSRWPQWSWNDGWDDASDSWYAYGDEGDDEDGYDPDYVAIFNTCCGKCKDRASCMAFGPLCDEVGDIIAGWDAYGTSQYELVAS